jgi:hypothetical protein
MNYLSDHANRCPNDVLYIDTSCKVLESNIYRTLEGFVRAVKMTKVQLAVINKGKTCACANHAK